MRSAGSSQPTTQTQNLARFSGEGFINFPAPIPGPVSQGWARCLSIAPSRRSGDRLGRGMPMPGQRFRIVQASGHPRPQAKSCLVLTMCLLAGGFRQGVLPKHLIYWSGREDSNLRPPHPQCDALPGCATSRPEDGPIRRVSGDGKRVGATIFGRDPCPCQTLPQCRTFSQSLPSCGQAASRANHVRARFYRAPDTVDSQKIDPFA